MINELVPIRPTNHVTPEEDMRVFATQARASLHKVQWPHENMEVGRKVADEMR